MLIAVSAACASPQPSPPSLPSGPISSPTVGPSATSSFGCDGPPLILPSFEGTRGPTRLQDLLPNSTEILVGRISGTGTPVWDTPGGLDPSRDAFEHLEAQISRPVTLDVERMIRGDAADVGLVIRSVARSAVRPFRTMTSPPCIPAGACSSDPTTPVSGMLRSSRLAGSLTHGKSRTTDWPIHRRERRSPSTHLPRRSSPGASLHQAASRSGRTCTRGPLWRESGPWDADSRVA